MCQKFNLSLFLKPFTVLLALVFMQSLPCLHALCKTATSCPDLLLNPPTGPVTVHRIYHRKCQDSLLLTNDLVLSLNQGGPSSDHLRVCIRLKLDHSSIRQKWKLLLWLLTVCASSLQMLPVLLRLCLILKTHSLIWLEQD